MHPSPRKGGLRLSKAAQRDRAIDRWASAGFIIGFLGIALAVIAPWGRWSWFALEVPSAPIAGWLSSSWLPFWALGGAMVWSLGVSVLGSGSRASDRQRWVWRWGGLGIVALTSVACAYGASRNGVALYEDRILWRQSLLAPLETTTDAEVAALNVRCEMKRRRRSLRGELIDVPFWTLSLTDGRTVAVGGVRGAGVGGTSRETWLAAMHRLSRYPVQPEAVASQCVRAVVARFEPQDRAFVQSLFAVSPQPAGDVFLCPPDYRARDAASGDDCLVVPVAPGPPRPRSHPTDPVVNSSDRGEMAMAEPRGRTS